jgi:acetyl-CoA carboxylase carboxyltransferase component
VPGTIGAAVTEFDGHRVVLAHSTSTLHRGALSLSDGQTLAEAAAMALRLRLPLVMVLATSGADVTEGVAALHGWGTAAAAIAQCSGNVPLIVVLDGPALSGPALILGLCDLVLMTPQAYAYVTGPANVMGFTGVSISTTELGGSAVHAVQSGVCCLEVSELHALIPDRPTSSYDVRGVIATVSDDADYLELWPRYAPQLITALAHVDGRTVGYLANQPQTMAGTLDINASQKGARFVNFCDSFNIPLITLVDTPGFLPGKDLEWRGMIRHGAELVFAYAEATVPRVCIILRKAFGGAYIVMDSKNMGNDLCYAWPAAQIAVMGAQGAAQILYRKETPARRAELQAEYAEHFLTPYKAAERGYVDDVIDPATTRAVLSSSLALLASKREHLVGRKHDNGPL